ncbi:MAG: GldG family protein [Acidiferrobacterales bacterium]
MPKSLPPRFQLRLINAVFVLLFLAAVGLLQWLSYDYHLRFDWTQSGRNSLSAASVATLKLLHEPLQVTAFASDREDLRKAIREVFGRYQRYKSDIELEFVDPSRDPERVRAAGVRFDGEVVLGYDGGTEALSKLNEESITNALARLARRGERWLVFVSGHGERSPDRHANFDLSRWTNALRKRGFATRVLTLADHPQVPRNTAALVIAGPRADLLPGEVKLLADYVENGGNLLWLVDPGPLHGLEPIAETLGIEFLPGVIIDPGSETITGNATAVVVTRYGAHSTVKSLRNVTLFPKAVGLRVVNPEEWNATVLFDTRASAWSETGILKGKVQQDKEQDVAGPLNLAVALRREHGGKEQRVVVVGDGDFLSNTFLANGINLELGVNIANWVSQDDTFVDIPVRVSPDHSLQLTPQARLLIGGGSLFALPILLAASGAFIWLRRRRL